MIIHNKYSGFSLLELMVTLAIVAILAAIAVPSYTSFLYKGELRTATADVKALSLNIENQYQKTLAYKDLTAASVLTTEYPGWKKASSSYDITAVASSTGGTYTITATGNVTGNTTCTIALTNLGTCTVSSCKTLNGSC